jgi:2-polyprenyl-6-methoxyphenol hydroxylase-like FAD-dependent oxidoreductase
MSVERGDDVDILIQGAGIGGLTLAIALIRKGYTVRIVERASGLSEVGAGIWMAANPMQVFDRLGFAEKIIAVGWTVHRITLEDYNGEILQTSDLSAVAKLFGFETVALPRSALQRVLSGQLLSDVVTFGTEVKNLSQSADAVSVLLTDGSRINEDCCGRRRYSFPDTKIGLVRWRDALFRFLLVSSHHQRCKSTFSRAKSRRLRNLG